MLGISGIYLLLSVQRLYGYCFPSGRKFNETWQMILNGFCTKRGYLWDISTYSMEVGHLADFLHETAVPIPWSSWHGWWGQNTSCTMGGGSLCIRSRLAFFFFFFFKTGDGFIAWGSSVTLARMWLTHYKGLKFDCGHMYSSKSLCKNSNIVFYFWSNKGT